MSRPEWIGEVANKLTARVSYSAFGEWNVDGEVITSNMVPGAALEWTAAPCPAGTAVGIDCTAFSMLWQGTRIPYGSFASYQVCATAPVTDRCSRFAELEDENPFAMLAGDAFRRATGSELAIVPGGLVDPDAQVWLRDVFDVTHTRLLTRFILERLIYRSFRIVRATVSGDQLVTQVNKALSSAAHSGSCIVGLSATCSTTIDTKKTDQVTINGRLVDPRLFYTIAMPDGLAEELALSHSDDEVPRRQRVESVRPNHGKGKPAASVSPHHIVS
jgi:hypothetical protein